ncbi:MAG: ribonuclease T2 family protein [Hyphomicrobium sp.]
MRLQLIMPALLATIAVTIGSSHAISEPRAPWPSERFAPQNDRRNVAGEFDYYALSLSWSPTYCSDSGSRDDTQCNRRDGRRFAFVLHGLWPQYEKGWPESCRTPRRPFVPEPLIDGMLDIMPSRGLIIHEYRKHGVCSGLDAQGYFTASRRLFNSIRIPDAYQNPFEIVTSTPRDLVIAFARANPQLKPDSIAVVCEGRAGRLKEVRICFSKEGQSRPCGENESARRLCSADRIYAPPVRSTARDDAAPSPQPYDPRRPLPGFRSLGDGARPL